MTDDKRPDVRRVSRKDQKREIKQTGPLIPDDQSTPYDALGFQDDSSPLSLDDLEALVKASGLEAPPAVDTSPGSTLQTAGDILPVSDAQPPRAPVVSAQDRYPPIPQPFPAEKGARRKPMTQPRRRRHKGNWRHDALAGFFLAATAGLIVYFVTIWNDPFSSLNPLAPPTPFVVVSETPDATALAVYYATQTVEAGPILASTPNPVLPFRLVDSGVIYIANANDSGCNWASIAGTVTGMAGEAVNGYGVRVVDAEAPERLDVKVFSGSALAFGDGGFELVLGGTPQAGQFTIQLFSPVGAPVSDAYTVITHDTCDENVAVVSFVQAREF